MVADEPAWIHIDFWKLDECQFYIHRNREVMVGGFGKEGMEKLRWEVLEKRFVVELKS